ncbi:MAG TPA: uroporphyrinogen-III synthase [Candidatus Limnocylindria bacterium]|nr:uroporphyrinogen-III synthase [Candidatus Limnocylindria bacterium]
MSRVLVTRPAAQAGELAALLADRGIESVTVPTVEIEAAPESPLDGALQALGDGDWLVVTSANGAEVVGRRAAGSARPLRSSVRIAAVGPATAARLAAYGLRASHVPERYLTAAIAEGMDDVAGRRVLLARADASTPELRAALEARSALVNEVVAYRTIIAPEGSRRRLAEALEQGVDGLTFTSSSTVHGLVELASSDGLHRARRLPAFCIGPVTARAAEGCHLTVAAVAEEHTAVGLAAAVALHFTREET